MSNEQKRLTYGERLVRASFNPSADSVVDRIKQKHADIIDLLKAEMESTDIPEEKSFFQRAINKQSEASMLAVYALTAQYVRGQ